MFAIDLILSFRTSVIDEVTGHEIINPLQIAKMYLKGRFVIDLFATVPFDTLFQSLLSHDVTGQLSLFSLLKLFRLFRLTKIIMYLNTSENIKHSLKIFKLLFFLVVYIHCQACAWFYYTKIDKTWFPLGGVLLD